MSDLNLKVLKRSYKNTEKRGRQMICPFLVRISSKYNWKSGGHQFLSRKGPNKEKLVNWKNSGRQ